MTLFDGTIRPALSLRIKIAGVWTTVSTDDILEWSFMRGRRERFDQLPTSKLFATLNNTAGTYSTLTAGQSVQLRMVTTISGTPYTDSLFYGEIRTAPTYPGTVPVTQLEVVDAVYQMGKTHIAPEFWNANNLETSGVRSDRITTDYPCGLVGFTDNGYAGAVNMLSSFGNQTVLEALEQCHAVEAGFLYVDRTGTLVHSANEDKFNRTTAKFTFSDATTSDTAPVLNAMLTPAPAVIVNTVTVQRPTRKTAAGTSTKVAYGPSVASYGTHAMKWTATNYTDESAEALATYLARVHADPGTTPTMIEFSGIDFLRRSTGTLTYRNLTTLELGDWISGTLDTVSYSGTVQGIQHIAQRGNWIVRLYLSPYETFTCDIPAGLATDPAWGTAGQFVYHTPADWTLGTPADVVRTANSLDVKWEDFADRGAATGGTTTPLELYANGKQVVIYDSNSTGAYQFDLKGGSATAMNVALVTGQCVTFNVSVKCNNATHYAHATIKVDGSTAHIASTVWFGGAPSAGTNGGWDKYALTCMVIDDTTPSYRVEAMWLGSA